MCSFGGRSLSIFGDLDRRSGMPDVLEMSRWEGERGEEMVHNLPCSLAALLFRPGATERWREYGRFLCARVEMTLFNLSFFVR